VRILNRAECRELMVEAFAAGMRGEELALGGEGVYCRREDLEVAKTALAGAARSAVERVVVRLSVRRPELSGEELRQVRGMLLSCLGELLEY
jgi:hypothetical protein